MMNDFRSQAYLFLNQLISASEDEFKRLLEKGIHEKCVFDISAPLGLLIGRDAFYNHFLKPVRNSLHHVRRRDIIFLGSQDYQNDSGKWVGSVTHYTGNFHKPLFGVRPSQSFAFFRAGEFYRIENNQIVEGKILFDLPNLMQQTGHNPFPETLGTQMIFPAPASLDGVLPDKGNGKKSVALMNFMLKNLIDFDPETKLSKGMTGKKGVWHDDMMWYGPAGIGASYRWEGFVKDHRNAFLNAFPNRTGGEISCKIGDGHYAALAGWPGMEMTHKGDYLGLAATGRDVVFPVMDFYRCQDNKLIENWVFLDYISLFKQLGVDLISRHKRYSDET